MIQEHMITFKKLQLVKEMITQMVVYFKEHCNMTAIDLSKQQAPDAGSNVIQ